MADSNQLVKHIESYVGSSSSPSQQAASLDAIAAFLKNDVLTMEKFVREMGMYLTTTDSIIRARGMLLLGELLTVLVLKPLDDASLRSLIKFFAERLADWKALHGAIVGCLALLNRKSNVGMISVDEAREVAQSYLQNLQVQSLGQHDRKLCFELLECLLDRYPDAVVMLGDDLVYGICEAIDGEKDPQCLMITFHVVEILGQLFPDPSGPLASFAGDLFEILGCYFPIHFTHPNGEEVNVNRDELSTSLMVAFASTPLFEPFAIPLLLEKLSSSLPSAKVESLRYLSYCSMKYGSERMAKHIAALWPLLKEAIQNSLQPTSSIESETFDGVGFQENQIVSEALKLLQKLVQQDDGLFSSLIVGDEEINSTIQSISSFKNYVDIPTQNKHKLHAVGQILSVSAGASVASCNRVFESFFLTLMDALGLSGSSEDSPQEGDYEFFEKLNYGALFLCIELLDACKHLVVSSKELNSITVSPNERWCCMLQGFCGSLIKSFSCALMMNTDKEAQNAYICSGVKGLQILATLPGNVLPVSKSIFENILKKLMSVITLNFNKSFLWKLSLKALVEIGTFVDTCHKSDKAQSFKSIVVEKIVFLISSDDSTLSLSHKLEAISEIGRTGLDSMLTIVKGLENTIFAKLSVHQVEGTVETESTIELLECFSNKLLPWFDKIGGLDEVPFHFVLNFWDHIEKSINFSIECQEKGLLDAIMTAMKQAVAKCSEKSQSIIIQRAFCVFMSTTSFPLKDFMPVTTPAKIEASGLNHGSSSFPLRDEWIISLLASVIISLRPETHIPNIELILQKFMAALFSGNVPAAQALGSIVNKLPLKVNTTETSDGCSLEEALDIIHGNSLWTSDGYSLSRICGGIGDGSEIGLSGLRLSTEESWLFHVHVVVGLAWIGKGLLMRGHEKVKGITMTIWSCLLSNGSNVAVPCPSTEQDMFPLMKSAADAFHVLMSDSEACLNRRFHAIIRPLYKQRYFSTMMPIMLSSVAKSDSSITRSMLHRAFVHILSDTPLSVVLTEAKKLISVLADSLTMLSKYILNKDILCNALLVLSGILMDKNGQEAVIESAHIIIDHLIRLTFYPHMMLVRETAIQCLVAMSTLPHARIYPLRTQVLRAISKSLDDPKRAVRQEAVRCRRAWSELLDLCLCYSKASIAP